MLSRSESGLRGAGASACAVPVIVELRCLLSVILLEKDKKITPNWNIIKI